MIRQFFPSTDESDFAFLLPAYLNLVNAPDTLKFLSYTGMPFTESQVSVWFRSHTDAGIDYYADIDPTTGIQGIVTVKANSLTGFELLGLVVDPYQRRNGIGKNLVKYILTVAANRGYKAVDVNVFADNLPMLRLVMGHGFIPVSMSHHARFDGADVVVLKCYL
jgi:ribosomal protein S18 acetylase RimI-like enzyme